MGKSIDRLMDYKIPEGWDRIIACIGILFIAIAFTYLFL